MNTPIDDIFIADLHLSAETPDTVRAFFAFLTGAAATAQRLFILGDLFEYWAGDDDIDTPFNTGVCERLRTLVDQGTEVAFMAGNRDFLIGQRFSEVTGIRLLNDPTVIETAGHRVLLLHGDTLCTDDRAYQDFRAQVRNPVWQKAFLAKPLSERKAIIAQVREHSEAAKQVNAMEIMDVNEEAVRAAFLAHDCEHMIHGHTHRPATHTMTINGTTCERWVLADWHGNAPCIVSRSGALARAADLSG